MFPANGNLEGVGWWVKTAITARAATATATLARSATRSNTNDLY
jgi:hypothetical protein